MHRDRFDHVGVERPLDEEADVVELRGLALEDIDEDACPMMLDASSPGRPSRPARRGSRSEASTRWKSMWKCSRKAASTSSPSFLRITPLSTKMHDRLVADRACGRAPPRRSNRRRRRGRRSRVGRRPASRIFATCSSMKADIRQSPRHSATPKRKFSIELLAVVAVVDLGVELDAVDRAAAVTDGRERAGLRARQRPRSPLRDRGARPDRRGSSRRPADRAFLRSSPCRRNSRPRCFAGDRTRAHEPRERCRRTAWLKSCIP